MRHISLSLLVAGAAVVLAGAARGESQGKSFDARAAFAEADINGDGEIDLSEFHARLIEIFFNADTNKDGSLSPDEYKQLPFSGSFKDADRNGDGRISLHEFVAIRFRQFTEADTDRDGELSLDEALDAYAGRKKP
jgi:EF hand domain-containing protein